MKADREPETITRHQKYFRSWERIKHHDGSVIAADVHRNTKQKCFFPPSTMKEIRAEKLLTD